MGFGHGWGPVTAGSDAATVADVEGCALSGGDGAAGAAVVEFLAVGSVDDGDDVRVACHPAGCRSGKVPASCNGGGAEAVQELLMA